MSSLPLEVVILNDHAAVTGGSSAVALASAQGLAARGVPVTLFTCVGPVDPQLRATPQLEIRCLDQHEIARNPSRLQAMTQGLRNRAAVTALRALLRDRSPARTIVHAHTWTKALSPFALAAVAELGFPLVLTLHDYFLACPNGGFFVYGENTICTRTPLSRSCWSCRCDRRSQTHKLWRLGRTVLQNRVLRVPARAAGYIGVSAFSLDRLRPYLPATVPTRVIRHPVESAPAPPAPVARNRTFLFIGRFEVEKGAALFAEAVRDAGVPATFIGDGALMGRLRARCPQATFTGWLGPEEIRRHLRAARALVFPPLWYETLGLVVIEAAAAGVPALVASGCAATGYIRDGVNGLHFAHGSAAALARQMAALARQDDLAARLGRAAYDWYWSDPWTREQHVDALLEFYHEVARQPAPAPHDLVHL